MNQIPIKDLSQIFPGVASQAFKQMGDGIESSNALVLRGKEFSPLGEFNVKEMEPVSVDASNTRVQRCFLQEGDVVLLARGSAIRAGYVPADVARSNIIATANFILIRPDQDKVLGEVITAYINSPQGRSALLNLSVGTAVQQVPASGLRKFSVPVPSKDKQRIIADLHRAGISAYHETLSFADQQLLVANTAIATLLHEVA